MAYPFIFTFVGALFAAAVASAWVSPGAIGWLAGFIYIFYDSCILVLIARSGRAGLPPHEGPPDPPLPSMAVLIAARNERADYAHERRTRLDDSLIYDHDSIGAAVTLRF